MKVCKLFGLPPPLVVSLFVVVSLNLLAGVSRENSNFVLSALYFIVYSTCTYLQRRTLPISATIDPLLQPINWPADLRTAMKDFQLDPDLVKYASCPKCCCVYAPIANHQYPSVCTHKEFPTSDACGEQLIRVDGTPIRPFFYQPVRSWLGRLLSRPGIEEIMDKVWDSSLVNGVGNIMNDIWDGTVLRNLRGPRHGERFSDCPNREARLVFSLFVDWFNPFRNKISGKHYSVGAIYMICLNLPAHLRFRVENVYLVGIMPGPGEPKLQQINHYLSPLVHDLNQLWNPGVFFTRTAAYQLGRLVRCALVPLIADLPAVRKTASFAGHSASFFCSFCRLRSEDICNFAKSTWRRFSWAEHLQFARLWRDAESQSKRDGLFNLYGIRWSELLKLEYWNPTVYSLLDSMHNMFLGEFQRHVRVIWGVQNVTPTDTKQSKGQKAHTEDKQAEELMKVVTGISKRSRSIAARKGYVVGIAFANGLPIAKEKMKQDYWDELLKWVRTSFHNKSPDC